MNDLGKNLASSKSIIVSACRMLEYAQTITPLAGREQYASSADCYVLLHDATKLFCKYAGELHGETESRRWSAVVPELLLSHPEKCAETLALLECKDFKELSHFQFVAA